jgi:hypothetical protein
MCMMSAVGDSWRETAPNRWPNIPMTPNPTFVFNPSFVTKEEFDALKSEVEELRALLRAAKAFDEATGQPDCEVDEKVELIKRVAEAVGVDLEDLFG